LFKGHTLIVANYDSVQLSASRAKISKNFLPLFVKILLLAPVRIMSNEFYERQRKLCHFVKKKEQETLNGATFSEEYLLKSNVLNNARISTSDVHNSTNAFM